MCHTLLINTIKVFVTLTIICYKCTLPCAHLEEYIVLLVGSRDKQYTCDVLQEVDRVHQTGPS